MGPENKSTKHVKHPEPRTKSTIHVLTHQPTPPTHPPTQQLTDAPTCPPTMCYSNTAEYSSSSSRCIDDTNRVAVTLAFPCIYENPPPRKVSRPFPGRPPLAESFIGARSFAGKSWGCCVGKAWSHREAAGGQVELGSRSCFLGTTYIMMKIFSKIHLDITFTTEEHYIIRMLFGSSDVQMDL